MRIILTFIKKSGVMNNHSDPALNPYSKREGLSPPLRVERGSGG
jgi:hypothetical protein